jgi:hypothetical protein
LAGNKFKQATKGDKWLTKSHACSLTTYFHQVAWVCKAVNDEDHKDELNRIIAKQKFKVTERADIIIPEWVITVHRMRYED